jgi:magnesium transporter
VFQDGPQAMRTETITFAKEDLEDLVNRGDDEIAKVLERFSHAADISDLLRQIDVQDWPKVLRLIKDADLMAAVASELDRDEWIKLLSLLSPPEIANIIKRLESDDAADLLLDVPLPKRLLALRMLSHAERQQVQQLLRYPEDSAGGIMQLELALVQKGDLVKDAIKMVRQLVEDDIEVLSVLVVDESNRLVGSLALVDLLLNKETTAVANIMITDVVTVKPLLDQEEVASIFKKYDLIMVPVVDDKNRVLGRIVIDDVMDVVSEEAEEDALRMAGTSTEELVNPEAVFATARVRLPWLGVALFCSLISGLLLHLFEPTVERAVIILSFIPVITAMGGNVGTQSAALLIRGFGTGKFDLSDVPQFLFKELRVGLLMGSIYGFCAALVAIFILSDFNIYLGLVVFIAMTFAMMSAALLGVIAPSMLKRFNIDPAIASGPFVTTLNDISGIAIYMLIANLFLAKLQTI